MDWSIILIAIALAIVPAYLFKRKFKKIETHGPLCLWRTKHGISLAKKLSKCRFWPHFADLGVVFAFGLIGAIYMILQKKAKQIDIMIYYIIFAMSVIVFMPMMPAIGGKTFFLFFISLFVGGYGFFMLAQLGYGAAKVILDIMSGV
ncbi:MAG: hypothetical protein V1911_01995, partial [Candidatus Micrarchaeota archaeon]